MKRDAKRTPRPRMPTDREIREALVASGMDEGEAANAVSQLLRVASLDFRKRRRNRLFNLVQDRLIVVAAKTRVMDLLKREASGRRQAFNLEDLFTGIHHVELTNLGETVVRRAIRELEREGLIRTSRETANMELLTLIGRRPKWSASKLRKVYSKMRLSIGIKGARPYVIERTWHL